jgi:hypothetical protein
VSTQLRPLQQLLERVAVRGEEQTIFVAAGGFLRLDNVEQPSVGTSTPSILNTRCSL